MRSTVSSEARTFVFHFMEDYYMLALHGRIELMLLQSLATPHPLWHAAVHSFACCQDSSFQGCQLCCVFCLSNISVNSRAFSCCKHLRALLCG